MRVAEVDQEILPVSVIVPLFNGSKHVAECIASINQGIVPAEIIVVDDCSTDDSLRVVSDLSVDHGNIVILSTPINQGAHAARELGILNAKCPFIALVDADDLIEKDAIYDAYKRIKASDVDKRIDICIWDLWRLTQDGEQLRAPSNPDFLPVTGPEALRLTLGSWGIHILGVARKDLFLRAYRGVHINCINSDELISRLAFREARFVMGSPKKYFYRVNPDSTTQKLSDKHLTYLRSNLWLIGLASQTPSAPLGCIARQGIGSAYRIYRMRRSFDAGLFKKELRDYMRRVGRSPLYWRAALARPRSLFKLCLLCLVVKMRLL